MDQARGEVDPAALTAREVLDQAVAELADLEALDQLVGNGSGGVDAASAQAGHQDDVLARGQVLVERGELTGKGDRAPDLVRLADDIVARDASPARVGARERP